MIKPTIGRVVLFHPNKKSELVFPALVCCVHNDSLINVGGFDNNGNAYGATSVPLIQDGDEAPDHGAYATWMLFQLGQAAKTEEMVKLMKETNKPAQAIVQNVDHVERIVIGPSELDTLMEGSTEAPGMAEPSDEGTETKE